MKSKIRIDLDESCQPIIRIEYEQSDDVRDSLVKRFLENHSSTGVLELYYNQIPERPNKDIHIRAYTLMKGRE